MSHNVTGVENIILTPEKRIQQLLMLSSKIELNTSIAARKYGLNYIIFIYRIKYNSLILL